MFAKRYAPTSIDNVAASAFAGAWRVTCHTDHVGPGSTFVAIDGFSTDGARYIPQALERGATTVVVRSGVRLPPGIKEQLSRCGAELIHVSEPRAALAELAARAYDYPADQLSIIGITGTKGKTTTSFLLAHLLETGGVPTALIGTAGQRIGKRVLPKNLTTPQPDYLHLFFDQCDRNDITHVVLEVSAQALSLHRVDAVRFAGALFTNLAREHAEFYDSMEEYFDTKVRLFDQLGAGVPGVVNADDGWGRQLLTQRSNVCALSLRDAAARYFAHGMREDANGLAATFVLDGEQVEVHSPALMGEFSLYNMLAAAALAHQQGMSPEVIREGMHTFAGVPGRLERIALANGAHCIVDYAHNPSSFDALLTMLRARTHQLIVVFGAAGGKDRGKRPLMGTIAARLADQVILTADNPSFENPDAIVDEICAGVAACHRTKFVRELDRECAIKLACTQVGPGGIVAILGKGNDEYQDIAGVRTHFSDREIASQL